MFENTNNLAIGHCPICQGVIFKEGDFKNFVGSLSMMVKCPHCGSVLKINIFMETKFELSAITPSSAPPETPNQLLGGLK